MKTKIDQYNQLDPVSIELEHDNFWDNPKNKCSGKVRKVEMPKLYSREEVEILCKKAYNYGFQGGEKEGRDSAPGKLHSCNSINDWLKENL